MNKPPPHASRCRRLQRRHYLDEDHLGVREPGAFSHAGGGTPARFLATRKRLVPERRRKGLAVISQSATIAGWLESKGRRPTAGGSSGQPVGHPETPRNVEGDNLFHCGSDHRNRTGNALELRHVRQFRLEAYGPAGRNLDPSLEQPTGPSILLLAESQPKVFVGSGGSHAPARRAVEQAQLHEVGFVDILNRAFVFAE